jgi:hypothetical protein
MQTIYKYEFGISGEQVLKMPDYAEILKIAKSGDGRFYLWALVDTNNLIVKRRICVFGTGHPIPQAYTTAYYIDTVFDGPYVWHVFEAPND